MEVLENMLSELKFESSVTSSYIGDNPEEVISSLEKFNIEWHVTKEGSLMVKSWRIVADKFVSRERAAIIRAKRSSTIEGNTMDWIGNNLEALRNEYGGKWIAIYDREVVRSATQLNELLTEIKELDRPFITFIPAEQVVWNFAYVHKAL